MALTIYYDEPINNTLAADNNNIKLPIEPRNFSRTNNNFATVSGTVTFDSSYPTGGYGPMNNFGMKKVAGVFFEDVNGYGVMYNRATDKIQVFSTAGTEVAAATNLSALQAVYFEAKGRQY
ncbi:hypothetical protein SD70_27195 [Gordoniibacillus kamchatkensis]|uniref:Uncharacterized protein n=1 Tax=Gordoniibacillus kamchatkensis TaxID=1590651 RepID=A0ABR5AB88_9BACL|nr:hypothetical protein [Paenibacillus sp. VKM B-2647]KIL38304.1 hypothetical protein SD70_27195 [Paenibacillus sp. VKM B-2647]